MSRLLLSLFFLTTSVHAFNLISFDGKPTRWARPDISYAVDAIGSADFASGCDKSGSCESERTAIQKAFSAWAQVSGVDLNFRENAPQGSKNTGYDGKNSVVFIDSDWGNLSFRPPSGALAVTITTYRLDNAQILDADIHFNGQYFTWGVVNSDAEKRGGVVDIQNVATHEIGHFLGLGHSSENYSEPDTNLYMATMFFASGPGETFRRTLKADDIAAIRHLYPEDSEEKPIVNSIYPKDIDARSVSVASIEILGGNFTDSTSVTIARKNDRGDVSGKIVSRSEGAMQVSFETYGMGTGTYDVVIANSVVAQDRMSDALSITAYIDEEDTGQYGELSSSSGGCAAGGSDAFAFLLMVGLPLLLIFPGRLQGAPARSKKNSKNPFLQNNRR